MTFEELFDLWLAKRVCNLFKSGYNVEQVKIWMNLLYSDFCDIIDNEEVLNEVKNKIIRTVEIFVMGEQNDKTN